MPLTTEWVWPEASRAGMEDQFGQVVGQVAVMQVYEMRNIYFRTNRELISDTKYECTNAGAYFSYGAIPAPHQDRPTS